MYIFKILEVEAIIFSYLDQISDWINIKQLDRHYHKLIQNNLTFCEIKSIYPKIYSRKPCYHYFHWACQKGLLFGAKYFYYRTFEVNLRKFTKAIFDSSANNDAHVYFNKDNSYFISCDSYDSFVVACSNNHINVAKWLLTLENINLKSFFSLTKPIKKICKYEYTDTLKWLLNLAKNSGINPNLSELFKYAAKYNNFDMAKWIFSLDDKINIHIVGSYAFFKACKNNNFEMAKWLVGLNKNINIHSRNEGPFRYSCKNGNFEMAKWLYGLDGNINIHKKGDKNKDLSIGDNYAFKMALQNNHLDIAYWLFQLDENINLCDSAIKKILFVAGDAERAKWLFRLGVK